MMCTRFEVQNRNTLASLRTKAEPVDIIYQSMSSSQMKSKDIDHGLGKHWLSRSSTFRYASQQSYERLDLL